MSFLRTPDEQFASIQDFPFQSKYVQIDGMRMHYVDEGSGNEVSLMLHGEPSWSYLYRKMIPVFVAAGFRAVAPDLIGFGKSDKPTEQSDYTYQKHVDWVKSFLEMTDLKNITLFCQDWGGLIGLRLAAEDGDRFARIVAANTGLPNGMVNMPEAFMQWREFSRSSPKFNIEVV